MKRAKTKSPHEAEKLSIQKKWIFRFILLLIPFVFFISLELVLNFINYGGNLDLVIKKKIGDKEFYTINRYAARKYFSGSGTVTPEPVNSLFEINKSDSTKRIFCLGESTMAGFPYPSNATAPNFLRQRLQDIFPHSKIEVINVGLSAISSYIVLDFIEELMSYEPDLFIVYVGHNEFYGVYGAGSSIRLPGGHWLTQLNIKLLKFRTYLLLRDAAGSIRNFFFDSNRDQNITLMGRMVQEQYIPYQSDLYLSAKEAYHNNLESIISVVQQHNIPIIFSGLVSNVKDHHPFHSVFSDKLKPEILARWQSLKDSADSLFAMRHFHEASALYKQCINLDSLNASAYYFLGLAEYNLGRFDIARKYLNKAKDYDALRFRVTEEFKDILKDVCSKRGVSLAPVDSAFESNSPNGITGRNLMLEHLHPNIKGYSLMAKVFAKKIIDLQLFNPIDSLNLSDIKDDEYYISSSGVTIFEETVGRVKVDLLTHKWPFVTDETDYNFIPGNEIERIVYRYIEEQLPESKARYELADYLWEHKDYNLAYRECYALSILNPFSYKPYLKLADYYRIAGKPEDAKKEYLHSIEIEDNPFARSKLAIMFLEEKRPDQAAIQLEAGFRIAGKPGMTLSRDAAAVSHYLLGASYAMLGKLNLAREQLKQSLSLNPRIEKTHQLLQQVERQIISH
jgi:tetratricopeptide (TPR) repeat protein